MTCRSGWKRTISAAVIVVVCLNGVGCGNDEAAVIEANRAIEQEAWDLTDEALRDGTIGPRQAVIADMEAVVDKVGTMREEDPDTGEVIDIDDTTFWEEDGNLVPYETMNTGQWYAFSVWLATPRVDEVIGTEITRLRHRAQQLDGSSG